VIKVNQRESKANVTLGRSRSNNYITLSWSSRPN